jgi:hypothetical protein
MGKETIVALDGENYSDRFNPTEKHSGFRSVYIGQADRSPVVTHTEGRTA